MKLARVLSACSNWPAYTDFIPVFINQWTRLYPDVKVSIVWVDNDIPPSLRKHEKHLLHFRPPANMPHGYAAQHIRMLYPAILKDHGAVLVTDLDFVPLSRNFWKACLAEIAPQHFVAIRGEHIAPYSRRISMGYNAATPSVLGDIFSIRSESDIREYLAELYRRKYPHYTGLKDVYYAARRLALLAADAFKVRSRQNYNDWQQRAIRMFNAKWPAYGWRLDEESLYQHVHRWNRRTAALTKLWQISPQYHILERNDLGTPSSISPEMKHTIKSGHYVGLHCPRPHSQYADLTASILDAAAP